jgi:hypothetical protein
VTKKNVFDQTPTLIALLSDDSILVSSLARHMYTAGKEKDDDATRKFKMDFYELLSSKLIFTRVMNDEVLLVRVNFIIGYLLILRHEAADTIDAGLSAISRALVDLLEFDSSDSGRMISEKADGSFFETTFSSSSNVEFQA